MRLATIALCFVFLCSCTGTGKKTEEFSTDSTLSTENVGATVPTKRSEDTTVKFVWRENRYNAEIKDSVSTLLVNDAYCNNISDAERAALGYVSTFIGSECWWDGEPKDDRSNLQCKILTALDLGYQCSDKHLGFLRNWFKGDKQVLAKLESCPTVPYTATHQSTFDEITINRQRDTIRVTFKASYINVRENKATEWTEIDTFLLKNDQLNLLSVKSSR